MTDIEEIREWAAAAIARCGFAGTTHTHIGACPATMPSLILRVLNEQELDAAIARRDIEEAVTTAFHLRDALAARDEQVARLREYVRHTTDDHGYPCPEGITRKERAAGVRCICGLDAPRRNLNHTPEPVSAEE